MNAHLPDAVCGPINILYLHCHDAGRYVQPYGAGVRTPALQRLAEEGVLFRDAHCANPTCSPSRACLLTGQYAHSAGMLGLTHRGWTLRDYGQTLMSFLGEHGYHTVLCGQQHIATPPFADPAESGYSEILTTQANLELAPTLAEKFLDRIGTEQPFFLDVGFHAPHRDGNTGDFPRLFAPEDERYVRVPPTLPDTPETRRDFALYAASVRSTDFAMGRVLDALERSGHAGNTLVLCTTDHGIAFPHMKCRLTSHGTGVMLILRGPGGFRGGKVVDSLVSHVDIFPTLCSLLGIQPPAWLQGESFLPLVQGETSVTRDAVFAEVNHHAATEPMRSVRTKRWNYIRSYSEHSGTVLPNIDNSLSKLLLTDHDLASRPQPAECLYDLVFDPQETCNLATDPAHAEILATMRKRLETWMRETDDPLLNGCLPVCKDMRTTDCGAYSPDGSPAPTPEMLP